MVLLSISVRLISSLKENDFTLMKWVLKKFRELTLDELYAILQLRSKVFIVEQYCI
jgi:hypothetical protein